MIEDNVLHHRWYNKKAGFFYLSWHCVYVDIHSFKCCSLKSNIFQNRHFFRYSHTGKTNLLAFWCQKLDQYLLNNLHIIRSTITLNKVKKNIIFKLFVAWNFRPTEVWRPIGAVIVSLFYSTLKLPLNLWKIVI